MKSIWATGRPGSFMEMRRPVKQCLKTPGTMGSSFTILSGRQKRSAGLGACGSRVSPVLAQQLALHNRRSLTHRGNFCVTERVRCCCGSGSGFGGVFLIVWGGVLGVLWCHHPEWLLTAKLNNFCPIPPLPPPFLLLQSYIVVDSYQGLPCHCFTKCNVNTYFVLMSFTIHSTFWFFFFFSEFPLSCLTVFHVEAFKAVYNNVLSTTAIVVWIVRLGNC